jgi:sporulation protein YlmC with PRC-barrel domain
VIYLSQLIDAPIWDATGAKLGVIGDIALDLREPVPRVTGLKGRSHPSCDHPRV